MIELLPASAEVSGGELRIGGVRAGELAEQYGTPLLVLCERTLRERARMLCEVASSAWLL